MKEWLKAAGIRAIKTFFQAFAAGMTYDVAISELDWAHIASVAVVAAIYSIVTSLAGLPEATSPLKKNDEAELPKTEEEE